MAGTEQDASLGSNSPEITGQGEARLFALQREDARMRKLGMTLLWIMLGVLAVVGGFGRGHR
jgi:hypothetical protein